MIDIAIIGAGPAGVTAAVYAARSGLKVKVFESGVIGGQVATTSEIENFPPFENVSGFEFASKLMESLDKYNIEVIYDRAEIIEKNGKIFTVKTSSASLEAKSVIIANGAKRRKLGCKGEEEFSGKGVSWCAVCDGNFFRNKTVAVNGGGNSALEDALYLAGICQKVYLIHRRSGFRATDNFIKEVNEKENIEILTPFTVKEIKGDKFVSSIVIENTQNGEEREIETSALFEAVGLQADNGFVEKFAELDDGGYISADEFCKTKSEGIFAAGDTRKKSLRQIATAVSDGALAATEAYEYIKNNF